MLSGPGCRDQRHPAQTSAISGNINITNIQVVWMQLAYHDGGPVWSDENSKAGTGNTSQRVAATRGME